MTPEELRRQADDKDRAGQAALEAGDAREAAVLFHQAELRRVAAAELERLEKERLPGRSDIGHTEGMADVDVGERMSRARSKVGAKTVLGKAINASKRWTSARAYVADRFKDKLSYASWVNYTTHKPCPRWVHKQVEKDFPEIFRADFPGGPWVWPKGVTD